MGLTAVRNSRCGPPPMVRRYYRSLVRGRCVEACSQPPFGSGEGQGPAIAKHLRGPACCQNVPAKSSPADGILVLCASLVVRVIELPRWLPATIPNGSLNTLVDILNLVFEAGWPEALRSAARLDEVLANRQYMISPCW